MTKKFPETLYAKREAEDKTHWFNTTESLFGLAEMGETVRVGVYKLVEVREIETVINAKKVSK